MSAFNGPKGLPLGSQQIAVHRFIIYPDHSVDVKEGSLIGGLFTHHVQVGLLSEGEVLLLPCDKTFLRSLRTQIDNALGDSPRYSPLRKQN